MEKNNKDVQIRTSMPLTCIGQKGRAIYAIFSFDSADGEVKLEPALNKFFEYLNPRENVSILCHKWAILEKNPNKGWNGITGGTEEMACRNFRC